MSSRGALLARPGPIVRRSPGQPSPALRPRLVGAARPLGLGLLLLVLGCLPATGGSPAPAATPAAMRPDDRDGLPVGAVVSLSGRFSREGFLLRDGYETWMQAANEAGGIDVAGARRRVRLVLYDDQSEPLVATRMVEKLVREDGVNLLLGPFSSQITLAAATAAERLGALTVAPDASGANVFARGLQMLVSILPPEDRYFEALVELAERVAPPARGLALLVPDEPFFSAAAQGAVERASGRGVQPVVVERVPADTRDVSGPLGRLAQLRPALLAVAGEPEQLGLLLPQIRELALTATLRAAVPGPPLRDLPAGLRSGSDGLLTLDWWSPGMVASGSVLGSARDFAVRFERDHGYPPDARAAAAAAAGLAIQLGVERARSVDPRSVRAALGGLDAPTFWGRLSWDAAGRNRGAVAPVLQLDRGQRRVVYPETLAGVPFRLPVGGTPPAGD